MACNMLQNSMNEFSAELIWFYMHLNDILNYLNGKFLYTCNNFVLDDQAFGFNCYIMI